MLAPPTPSPFPPPCNNKRSNCLLPAVIKQILLCYDHLFGSVSFCIPGFPSSAVSSGHGLLQQATSGADTGSPWISSDTSASNVDINHVLPSLTMPVNCVDVEGNSLVCGTDGEALYLVNDLFLHWSHLNTSTIIRCSYDEYDVGRRITELLSAHDESSIYHL